MSERTNTFDLKLLTASKEVGLRRLRSYAASIGGGAAIFNSYEDLRRSLATREEDRQGSIVLHDNSVGLSALQLAELQRLARVFVLNRPVDATVPPKAAPCWGMESYMQCSLGAFLDSPVVRMSMAQLCKRRQPFHVQHLLRWGHAAQTWTVGGPTGVADASFAFIRSINLVGEGRRLTEMFSHLIQTGFGALRLAEQAVTFGSDGVLILVSARVDAGPGIHLSEVAAELRMHDFPLAIVNRLEGGQLELAALHYPHEKHLAQAERIVMVFNKLSFADAPAEALPAALDEAG